MTKSSPLDQSKRWSFTINNPTKKDRRDLQALDTTFIIVGLEGQTPPATPHYQGFVIMKRNQRLAAMKKLLPRAHLEVTIKSNQQNVDYCSKEGDIKFRKGTLPMDPKTKGQQEKERWEAIRDHAKANELDKIDASTYVRYYSTLQRIASDHLPQASDLEACVGLWIYGEAGVGKSTRARQEDPDPFLKEHTKWWDGYQNEETVLIEDLSPDEKFLGTNLKLWADKWKFAAEIKGKQPRKIRPKKLIVTSQYSIEEIWEDPKTQDALNRRFKKIHMVRSVAQENTEIVAF